LDNPDKSSVQSIYDLSKRESIYSKKVAILQFIEVIPMLGKPSQSLFQRHELIDVNISGIVPPTMPVSPDYTRMKTKDILKATEEHLAKTQEYMVKLGEYNTKRQESANLKNHRCIIYSDVNCTQEVMRIDGTQYVSMYGDFVWVIKDTFCEIYDIRTKQLLYTIYLV
jgi:hypothetical protein